jgi:hypothetical protein
MTLFACLLRRCGNVAAILELDENLSKYFKVESEAARWPCIESHSQALMRIAGGFVSSLPRQ